MRAQSQLNPYFLLAPSFHDLWVYWSYPLRSISQDFDWIRNHLALDSKKLGAYVLAKGGSSSHEIIKRIRAHQKLSYMKGSESTQIAQKMTAIGILRILFLLPGGSSELWLCSSFFSRYFLSNIIHHYNRKVGPSCRAIRCQASIERWDQGSERNAVEEDSTFETAICKVLIPLL